VAWSVWTRGFDSPSRLRDHSTTIRGSMHDSVRQIPIALRGLQRTPAFTTAAILILGFGIGTAVAMFTVLRAVLLERLPVRDPERVVVLSTYKDPKVEYGLSAQNLKEVRRGSRTI